ncbi:MAG: T9SS type A sorting domain-containing protein [Flavobacteriales bacterium]|nr:T9SS type A sorting domain-containing protein [Flavobacteriales bacterium]
MKSLLRVPFVHISQIASLLLAFALSTEVLGQSNHSVSFSGSTSDFNVAEKISAAAGNTDYYITFDGSNLYLGAFRTSGSFATTDNFTVYLDTDPQSTPTSGTGTTSGHSYNGVTGTLPFSANYVVHAEESSQEARIDTASWSTTIGGLSYNTGSTWREVVIPFSAIGNPDALYLNMWMGQSSAIYSNAPGSDLGSGANPTVVNYVGGFGVSALDCIPVQSIDVPVTATLINSAPTSGVTYGKVVINSGSYGPVGNFTIASGGTLEISGGTLSLGGTVQFGNVFGSGHGTCLNYTSGTLTSNSASIFVLRGEHEMKGAALTFNGAIYAHNKFTPLAGGQTTLGSTGVLDLRNGSYVNTNSLTYAAGSTLRYNTGSSYTTGLEWVSGATSGAGVPHHIAIGDVVANTVVNFGTSANYRYASGNINISIAFSGNGLTLSTVSGGDLNIGGNFTQNGTFTHNSRNVTFSGNSTQTITGSLNTAGTSNNFRTLVINNTTGGVTLNTDVRITGTSGDVLQLTGSATSTIDSGRTLTLEGNGGNILSSGGARVIQLNAANAALNITGTKTFISASGGTMSLNSLASGAKVNLSAAVNFGSGITTIGNNTYLQINAGGSVASNAPSYHSGSTLVYNQGGTLTTATEWVANTTSGAGVPGNVLIGNGVNTTLNFGASSQYRYAASSVQISASSALTLSSAAGGNLQLGGNFINNGTFTHNSRDVVFNGSSAQQITGTTNFHNVTLNNASGLSLNNSISIGNVLTMTSGNITLGANNLTLSNTATGAITGTFSSSRMIITNGAGQLIRAIATGGLPITYNFPVGDNTGSTEYSPASFVFAANGAARNIGVRVVEGNHPQLNSSPAQTDYLSRYWAISNSAASTYTYTPSFTYPASDLNGSESNLRMNMYNGSVWSQLTGSSSASNVLGSGGSLTNATMPLGATAEFTGRVNDGTSYVWNQTGVSNFNTAANWTPNRTTPAVNDVLVFNNNATTTATNVPTQTIGRLVVSGTTNVSFTSTTDVTLTMAGGNGNDLSIASGATVQLSSTGNNDLTFAFANACAGDISGTFVLNSNNNNGNRLITANSVTTVSGSMNNFGTVTSATSSLTFSAASNYRHNYTTTAGAIPVATWNTTSNCIIQGYTSNTAAPSNLNQTFGNFTWNCTGQTDDINLNGALTDIAGNFTVSSIGGNANDELILVNNTNTTINVGGNFAISGTNTEVRLSSANGAYTVNMNVGGGYTQSTASSILNLTDGDDNTQVNFRVAGLFNFNSGSITHTTGGTPSLDVLIEFNGTSAQTVNIVGTFSNTIDFKVNNPAGINLSGTIPVINDCSFYRTAGTITGGTITYGTDNTTLVYDGSAPMTTSSIEWPTTNDPENVTINSTSTVTLHSSRTGETDGVFTNLSGLFVLGSNDLTIANTAAAALVNSSPSATNMIVADGSGQLKRTLPNSGRDLYFYIGDMTGTTEYSGFRLNFSANSLTGRVVGVRVVDDTSANLSLPYSPIDYLSRHWIVSLSSNSGSYSYDPALAYDVAGDVNGTENNLQVAAFPSGASSWNHYSTTIASPTLTKTGTDLSQSNFSLNNAQFTGRTPVKYWNGSISNSWTVANNWTPSGVPTSTDNIDFNGNADNPCVLSSSATVNHLTFSDGGNFTAASGASLTVAGNFTYNPLASVSFNCNSSLSLTNTTFNQFIPALQYGTLNLGTGARTLASADTIQICGDYTSTSGTLTTTGSTVQFNGSATQDVLTRTATFNHLLISNTSATVYSAENITVNGTTYIAPGARLEMDGATLSLNGAASVDGFLRNTDGTVNTSGGLTFNSGSTYEHNYSSFFSAGTIPTSTWSTGSTCTVMGVFLNNSAPSGLGQSFHHFTWNCSNQLVNVSLGGALTTVNGDFTMLNTGSANLRLIGNGAYTMNIGGNMNITGGSLILKTGNNTAILNLAGNYTHTSGNLDFCSSNNGAAEIRITGNYARSGSGNLSTSGNTSTNGMFRFQGTTQTISQNTTGSSSYVDYRIASGVTSLLSDLVINTTGLSSYPTNVNVASGGTLDCGNYLISGVNSINTSVIVASGGTIRTANSEGFTASAALGTIRTDNRSYSSGGHYVYNGTTNQNTGNFFTVTSPTTNTVASLTIDNTGSAGNNTVTMNNGANISVASLLSFPATDLGALDVLTNRIQITNNSTTAVSRLGQGYVIGDLQRAITTGTNNYSFDVGTATGYSPVTINYVTVTNSGNAIVKATDGAHPQAATDGLSQTSYVNRWWTITNSGITSSASTNINAFGYQSADLIGGATSSSVKLARWNGTAWSYPTFTTAANQINGTALNNTTMYGQFFAADCGSFDVSVSPSSAEICNGGSVGLTASANFGSPTYSWSPATGLSATNVAAVTANPSTTQTYTVTGTTATNCTTTETVTVTVHPRPTGAISGTQSICDGSSANLSIAVTGTGPWSGTLSDGTTFSGSSNPIVVSVTPTSNTTYTIATLLDSECTAASGDKTGSAIVSINARPTASISGTQSICSGASANLTITVSGTGPWSGTLSNGASFSGSSSPITVSVSPVSNTTYTVATLSDANCASISGDLTGSAIVTVNSKPTGTISGTQTICNGGSASLSIAVTGTGPWSGTLSNGASFSGASSPITASVSPSSNTTITVATLSDSNCSADAGDLSGSAVITVNARPTGVIGGTQTVCAGSSASLYINVTGSGTFNGTLSPGAIPFSGSGPMIVVSVTPLATTTYTIATLSDANCSSVSGDLSGSATLTYHNLPTAGISGPSTVCQGSSASIAFSGTANAVITYTINGGSNQFITLDGSGAATLNTGAMWANAVYALVSVNDGTCSNSASGTVSITVNEIPEAEIDGATSICSGSNTTISFYGNAGAVVTYTVNGGSDQYITLNGSGFASFNTGALTSNTTYLLSSVSNGTCLQNIGMSAVVTMLGSTYYQDSDGDGFGNPLVSQVACSTPVGYVDNADDCCDTNADINPGTEWWADVDGDGFGGFVSEIGCVSGVDCNSASWPAQTIPYYPVAHGGTPYVLDCQDNYATAYPGATELCNNAIDDDCDGLINEGCAGIVNDNWVSAINVNLNNSNTHYPNCLAINGTLVNANISAQGNPANVPVGAGRDVWYKFVAPSTGVQIKVAPTGFDAIIELQNSSAVEVNCELANTNSGGQEILNYNSLTPGQTYYVGVRNRDISAGGTFTICVSPLMPSGCSYSTPVGGFTMCSNFKAVYRGATNYTFSFTGTGGSAAFPYVTTSATSSGLMPFTHPALDIRHGGVYSVKVDANYSLIDGNGNPEPTMTVQGSIASVNCTGVTIASQPILEVKSTQTCPAVLIRSNYLQWAPVSGNVNACGAINFTYEFTKVTDCTGATAIGLPFEVTTNGVSQYLNLVSAFPSNLASVGYWRVRIRPNYSYMTGTYGPNRVISVNGSSASMMLEEEQIQDLSERSLSSTIEANIYPNPNQGDAVNIHLKGGVDGEVFIRIFNSIGQVVFTKMIVADGSLNTRVEFEQALTSGFYSVEISNEGRTLTERMLIEK